MRSSQIRVGLCSTTNMLWHNIIINNNNKIIVSVVISQGYKMSLLFQQFLPNNIPQQTENKGSYNLPSSFFFPLSHFVLVDIKKKKSTLDMGKEKEPCRPQPVDRASTGCCLQGSE